MHCWARYLLLAVVVVLGTLSMMSACGRKGPLYLPEESLRKPASAEADIPTSIAGDFKAVVYENEVDNLLHFAMVKGEI